MSKPFHLALPAGNIDITKKIDIDVDEIYNLACPASPIQYQNNPININ